MQLSLFSLLQRCHIKVNYIFSSSVSVVVVWCGDVFPPGCDDNTLMSPSRALRISASPVGLPPSAQSSVSQPASSVGPATSEPPSRRRQIQFLLSGCCRYRVGWRLFPPQALRHEPVSSSRPPASQQVAAPPVGLQPTVIRTWTACPARLWLHGGHRLLWSTVFSSCAQSPALASIRSPPEPHPRDLLSQ